MRIRSLVSSAAVVGTLLASSALVSEALAQKGTVLAPSSGWAVSKIDHKAAPYCALARKYNHNTVLTVARNLQSETSLALDFQRPVFRAGGPISVILDPGAGQQRAYEITPVSSKAFVVKLGRDNSFFKALDRTGLLRVEMGGQSYHFNVADMDAGQFKLDACVANMVMPAAGEEEPLTPAPGVTQQAQSSSSYRQEINALRRQIAGLKDENNSLKVQIETRSGGVAETTESVAKLAGQIRSLEDQNASLKRQLDLAQSAAPAAEVAGTGEASAELAALQAENLRLKAELQTVKPQDEVVASLETEIQALQTQNDKLNASLDAQSEGVEVVRELRTQITALEAENTELNTQLLAANEDVRKEFEQQIAGLTAENAALKSNMDKKGVDADLLEQLRQQIAQAENENRLLQETASQAQANLEAQLREEKLQAVETEKTTQAARVAALENELSALRAENVQKAQELVEVGEGTAELQALQEENAVLTQKLASYETQRAQAETLVKRIELLEVEKTELEAQLGSSPSVSGENVSAELAALQTEVETLKAENVILDNQLKGEALSADMSADFAALQEENEALKLAVDESKAEQARLAALETEIETLQANNAALQEQLGASTVQDDLQVALSENAELLQQIKDKDLQLLELDSMRQELSALKEQAAPGVSVSDLEAQRDELKGALADVVEVVERYKAENQQQTVQIEELQDENQTLKLALEERQEPEVEQVAVAEPAPEPKPPVQSVVAPVEAPQAQQEAAPSVAAPTPAKKPQAAVAAAEPVSEDLNIDETGFGESVPSDDMQSVQAALVEVEAEMRNTDPDDQERLQQLAREHTSLKELAAQEAASQAQQEIEIVEASAESAPYIDVTGLNEAQIQEEAMKRQREAAQIRQAAQQAREADGGQIDVEEDIVLSQSADPFEDLNVETDEGAVVADAAPTPQMQEATYPNAAAFSVTDLIIQAAVSTPDKIKRVEDEPQDVIAAYQWNGGSIYGSAEQKPISSPAQFDDLVKDYLERTQSRCPGEFAIVPDDTVDGGLMRADSYEVACVGGNVSSGAALLFFNQGGTFTVVAHEAPTEELSNAMNMRNQVKRVVTGSSI